MIKLEELRNPDSCLNKARMDEMIFVTLERDAAAPYAILKWAKRRIKLGKNKPTDKQIVDALEIAAYIDWSLAKKHCDETAAARDAASQRCCSLDDDNDGNCRIHSAPGVRRDGAKQ